MTQESPDIDALITRLVALQDELRADMILLGRNYKHHGVERKKKMKVKDELMVTIRLALKVASPDKQADVKRYLWDKLGILLP